MLFGAHVPGRGSEPMLQTATSGSATAALKSVEKIRNVFPETWLWTNSTVG